MRHWKKKPWVDSEVRNWDYIADHIAPEATSSDAGKALIVGQDGKPEWGEGGSVFKLHIDYDFPSNSYTVRESYDEVYNAIINEKIIMVIDEYEYEPPGGAYKMAYPPASVQSINNFNGYQINTVYTQLPSRNSKIYFSGVQIDITVSTQTMNVETGNYSIY